MNERKSGQPWNDYPELSEEVKLFLNKLHALSDEMFDVLCQMKPLPDSQDPIVIIGTAVDDILSLAVNRRWNFMCLKASMVAIQAVPQTPMDN